MKCTIHWTNGKPQIAEVYGSLESADIELATRQERLEVEMESWRQEAQAAITKNELFRGGGILVLADLMRQHSAIVALRAGMKQYDTKT